MRRLWQEEWAGHLEQKSYGEIFCGVFQMVFGMFKTQKLIRGDRNKAVFAQFLKMEDTFIRHIKMKIKQNMMDIIYLLWKYYWDSIRKYLMGKVKMDPVVLWVADEGDPQIYYFDWTFWHLGVKQRTSAKWGCWKLWRRFCS